MKAMLGLEVFGYADQQWMKREKEIMDQVVPGLGTATFGDCKAEVWVAEIVDFDPRYGYGRSFLKPRIDFSKANSKLSRGVMKWYVLDSGRTYEVSQRTSWKNLHRYFCFVDVDGNIVKIDKKEVDAWLNLPGSMD